MRFLADRDTLTAGLLLILSWLPAVSEPAEEARYDGHTLFEWARLLRGSDPSTRLKAVEALQPGFGVQAVPILIQAVETGELPIRREAIRALALIRPPAVETITVLSKTMRDTDPGIRRAAAAALGDVGAISVLLEALKDPDLEVRRDAVRPLRRVVTRAGNSADPTTTNAVVTALADALKEPDGRLRRAVAGSLGVMGPHAVEAIPALAEVTRDSDPSVRGAAIEALGRIGSPAAVPFLVEALKDPRTGSLAVRALGLVGPPARSALPVLRELRSQERSGHSNEAEAAIRAIERD